MISLENSGLDKMKRKKKGAVVIFVAEIRMGIRVNPWLRRREGKKTNLPLSGPGEDMGHLKGFWSSDRDEPIEKNDQRDEIFPTNPNSR